MNFLERPNEPATQAQIALLTRQYPRTPASFVRFLSSTNGGYSPHAVVPLPDGTETSRLSFLGVGLNKPMSNVTDWRGLEQDLLPVVVDGGGNLFCLRMDDDQGSVWFWDHDTREAEKCADSWSDFVAQIRIEKL